MFNNELVVEVLNQIPQSVDIIQKRIKPIKTAADFLKNERRLQRLDSICMQLIALGESIKHLDKITNKSMLKKYPEFDGRKFTR